MHNCACVHSQGHPSPPETMMHFPPCFRFRPLFSKNFQTRRKIFTILPFPDKFLDFHPPKFLMTPYFPCFNTFPPLFCENYYFPLILDKFPPTPVLDKFTCFLHALRVFRFPPTLTMMHLCITQCTYWTPLFIVVFTWGYELNPPK